MPSKDELKSKVCRVIDHRSEEIIGIAKTILDNPETGFREIKTSHLVTQKFAELGISYRDGLAITGVKGMVQGSSDSPTVGILGELDALIVPDHPKADPQTGAAHACGHHAQIGILIGVAAALTESGVLPFLNGRVAFMAVPAEEGIEMEFREKLHKEGKLSFLGGKAELIRLGEFDDIDIAITAHTTSRPEMGKLAVAGTTNGTVAKWVQFIGKGAHAGFAPHMGINALNAAMLAVSAINTQRETFRDDDTIKVHSIITRGGEAVNIVPSDVRMEIFVRGKTPEAIEDVSEKVDRALRAGALAVGGKVRITTLPGYLPVISHHKLNELLRINALSVVKGEEVAQLGHVTASTDMGDVSHIMPASSIFSGGATGIGHGSDYLVQDYQLAVVNPAKAMAMAVVDLLADNAAKAREILSESKQRMTKQEYLTFMESQLKEEEYES